MTGTLTNYLFHQMKIGDRASLVRHVGPKDIELFAAVSGDANPAHLDPGFAAHGPFGHVVVHGMWTAALISAVLGTRLPGPGTIYLDQQIRFNKPVSPGDTITAEVEVAELIGADWLVYQDLDDLKEAVGGGKVKIEHFDCAVFDGQYVTGDVNEAYLNRIEQARNDAAKVKVHTASAIIDLHND